MNKFTSDVLVPGHTPIKQKKMKIKEFYVWSIITIIDEINRINTERGEYDLTENYNVKEIIARKRTFTNFGYENSMENGIVF